MEWVELPSKGQSTLELLQEFEKRFVLLLTLDRTMLYTSKVLFFHKGVDDRNRKKMGLLLGNKEGSQQIGLQFKGHLVASTSNDCGMMEIVIEIFILLVVCWCIVLFYTQKVTFMHLYID